MSWFPKLMDPSALKDWLKNFFPVWGLFRACERERWSINPTLGSYTTLTLLTHLSQETFYMEKQQWEYIVIFFICLMRLSKREKHEAETVCRPLNIWRTQWSEKEYKDMRVPADWRVKKNNYRNDALVSVRWNCTNRCTDQNIIGLPCLLKCTPIRWTTFYKL